LAGLLTLLGITISVCQLSAQTSADTKEKPKDEDPLVIEAQRLFGEGKLEDCFNKLKDAEAKNSQLPPARLMMARLLMGNQQTVQAGRQVLEVAITENTDHPEVYLTNGSIALAEGRMADTLLNCQIALQLSEGPRWSAAQRKTYQKEARAGMATAFEARKDWASARTHFAAWVDLDPKNAQLRQRMARALFLTGKFNEAFAELKDAADMDKTLDPPEVTLAILYGSIVGTEDKKKDPKPDYAKDAEKAFKDAINKYPDKARPHQAFGAWLLDTGRISEAKQHIDNAVKLEGKDLSRETKALLGLLARYNENYTTAEKYFDELNRDQPRDFFGSNQLALVLIEQEEPAKQRRATQLAEINVAQFPRAAEAYATLGYCLLKLKRLDEAERAMGIGTNSGQASADTAYFLSLLLNERKKYKEAYDVLQKALESKGVFVNRRKAEDFAVALKPKVPKEEKKDEKK
jgi:tetratricopeptide (TPR) repeat protein